jgi:multiple sugar transport system substrate-binding protein
MAERRADVWKLRRREFLVAAAAAAALPRRVAAAAAPWAERPGGKVDRVNFVVWTYGDIYTKISKKFADDWGVTVDSTISSFNDHPTKLMTMYAGGETIDVSQSSPFSFPSFISQGLVEPLDGLPGTADYLADFTQSAKQVAVYDGKLMGPTVIDGVRPKSGSF